MDQGLSEACVGVRCTGLAPYMWNSVLMVFPAVAISTFLGAINGYALTKWCFRGPTRSSRSCCSALHSLPGHPPSHGTHAGPAGLAGTVSGLILVHTIYGLAFTTLFFRNFFVSVSDGILQAAKIDGAGFFASSSLSCCRWRCPPSW